MSILSFNNAKTTKGENYGYMTGIVYMTPDSKVCPFSLTAECINDCLYTAGRGRFSNTQKARLKRKEIFYKDKDHTTFLALLIVEIENFIVKAKKVGLIPVIRLNGTTDISYEYIKYNGKTIFEIFPSIQFYDYTKIAKRLTRELPNNYDLTFSYSGTEAYQKSVNEAQKQGARIAVVFKNGLPNQFMGLKVIDGDKHDLRFTEEKNVVIGLKAKGKAIKSDSVFIIDTNKL